MWQVHEQVPPHVQEGRETAPAAEEDKKDAFEEEELQGTVEKMVLAHELAVNDSFRLESHEPEEGRLMSSC